MIDSAKQAIFIPHPPLFLNSKLSLYTPINQNSQPQKLFQTNLAKIICSFTFLNLKTEYKNIEN